MRRLIVRHIADSDPPRFEVVRHRDGKTATPVTVRTPIGYPVPGTEQRTLMRGLRWYLEEFLDYPFSPETEQAEQVLHAVKSWGVEAFSALFGSGRASDFYRDATRDGHERLQLQIAADDPSLLAWPWEAIHDPQLGTLAHQARIERRLNQQPDPMPLPTSLPNDRINILFVVARPYEGDVEYRSIARPLVELARDLPAEISLLRPPTFRRLQEHLRERQYYLRFRRFVPPARTPRLHQDTRRPLPSEVRLGASLPASHSRCRPSPVINPPPTLE